MNCQYCNLEIKEGQDLKYSGNNIIHSECYKAWTNKASGYQHLCPKCNSSGIIKDDNSNAFEKVGINISSNTCSLCNGRGYTKIRYVPLYKVVGYTINYDVNVDKMFEK